MLRACASRGFRALSAARAAAQPALGLRALCAAAEPEGLDLVRNIGVSAHIDSGKTTLTERILYYSGRTDSIHEVRGKDGVGATMDSMDLEREKGITIQSAATTCNWTTDGREARVNIIDTPGHVDFTIEVERALRVLDGGVLVLCGVSGVQSQSLTVDRQMKRYGVPRIAFINKLDRMGADPDRVIGMVRDQLGLNAAAVQVPIGAEGDLAGVVDLIREQALYNRGDLGEEVVAEPVPADMADAVAAARQELVEKLADVDEEIGDLFLMEEVPSVEQLEAAVRRSTLALNFVPVFMGSAFKNRGVQPLLDGVVKYLPAPWENIALDRRSDEEPVTLTSSPTEPLVALAFKLEEGRFGQLTYMRIYQGTLRRGDFMVNASNGKKIKVPRLVRMHADEMEEVEEVSAGDVAAMFGVDCASMDTFTAPEATHLTMTSMHVPEPVLSLAIAAASRDGSNNLSKALNRFTKEDPTFRVHQDPHTKETLISGMGELHLDIYIERMRREYNVEVNAGEPRVNYREFVRRRADFEYLHKKQSGGAGQYAKVIGYVEPISDDATSIPAENEFVNGIVGNAIPPEYITACEKGFKDACEKGGLIAHPVQNVRFVLTDGAAHAVDSSEMAFRTAAAAAMRSAMQQAGASIAEPVMAVEITAPAEFQGDVIAGVNRRKGLIQGSDASDLGAVVRAEVPLANMFGYATELRSATQGKGEFSLEYCRHAGVYSDVQEQLVKEYQASRS